MCYDKEIRRSNLYMNTNYFQNTEANILANQQVENLIDLLDERYTRSDVTDEEYDTGAKKRITPME